MSSVGAGAAAFELVGVGVSDWVEVGETISTGAEGVDAPLEGEQVVFFLLGARLARRAWSGASCTNDDDDEVSSLAARWAAATWPLAREGAWASAGVARRAARGAIAVRRVGRCMTGGERVVVEVGCTKEGTGCMRVVGGACPAGWLVERGGEIRLAFKAEKKEQ